MLYSSSERIRCFQANQESTKQQETMMVEMEGTTSETACTNEIQIKSEEEQLKLLQEQQQEIDSLKAKIQSNINESATLIPDPATIFSDANVINTDDDSKSTDVTTSVPDMEKSVKETAVIAGEEDEKNKDGFTVPMETSRDPEIQSPNETENVESDDVIKSLNDTRIEATVSPPNEVTTQEMESENNYDAEQIMKEALHRTEQDEANFQGLFSYKTWFTGNL